MVFGTMAYQEIAGLLVQPGSFIMPRSGNRECWMQTMGDSLLDLFDDSKVQECKLWFGNSAHSVETLNGWCEESIVALVFDTTWGVAFGNGSVLNCETLCLLRLTEFKYVVHSP